MPTAAQSQADLHHESKNPLNHFNNFPERTQLSIYKLNKSLTIKSNVQNMNETLESTNYIHTKGVDPLGDKVGKKS